MSDTEIRGSVPSTPTKFRTLRPGGIRSAAADLFSSAAGIVKTFYKSASRLHKAASKDPGPNGANGEIEITRQVSRFQRANNGYYRNGMRQVANNVVSYGITPVIPYSDLKALFRVWSPEADARGRYDFYGLQWHAVETVATDGEVLFRLRDRLEGDMMSGVPLQIQMLQADHLPLGWTQQAPSGNWIIDGVERNAIDRVVNYWLYQWHPKDWRGKTGDMIPKPVPAEDVLHMFIPDTPSSERGSPWAAPVLDIMDILQEYRHNEVGRKRHQSKFTVFYKKPLAADDESAFGDDEPPKFQSVPAGGAVEVPEGYDVSFPDQPGTDNNFEAFNRVNLSEVAVCIGLCVEQLTLDFKDVNDRVYRAMMLEVGRFILSIQHHMVIQQFCAPVWRRWVSAAILAGKWTPPADAKPEDYMRVEWMPPARGHIHPIQEVTAFMLAVQNGFTSRQQVASEFGYDIEEIDLQNAKDSARAGELRLPYPVYEGAGAMPQTQAAGAVQALAQKAVMDALFKMAEEEAN
ncbi:MULTISPECIES: phage portal protein [Rhizobium]|uniref:phage portal protein n=1 Tax=Rhizobium TaxID=379 RepID=UPI00040282FC|nr:MULTISPECIES: phage portal protein [Rhizobium]UFS81552.1 phage portal protein [Rhizobium sp. T136]